MLKTLICGVLLAVLGALTVVLGDAFGLELDHVALLGLALGAVVGLVPDGGPVYKVAGFLGGVLCSWAVFGLRASWLPDTSSGRAVAVFLAIALCLAVTLLSMGRIPFWSTLVGAAGLAGAYEATYTAAPSQFLHESPTALTTLLLAAAIGHLATLAVLPTAERRREPETVPHEQRQTAEAAPSVGA